jgi:hypothetical protein
MGHRGVGNREVDAVVDLRQQRGGVAAEAEAGGADPRNALALEMIDQHPQITDRLRHRLGEVGESGHEQLGAVERRAGAAAAAVKRQGEQDDVPALGEELAQAEEGRVERRAGGAEPVDHDQRRPRTIVMAPVLGARHRVVGRCPEAAGEVRVQRLKRALEAQQFDVTADVLEPAAGARVHGDRRGGWAEHLHRVMRGGERRVVLQPPAFGLGVQEDAGGDHGGSGGGGQRRPDGVVAQDD